MPVPGPAPKPANQRRRRNADAVDWLVVVDRPFRDGPDLPAKTPQGETWPASVRSWWRVVRAMPHCTLWARSDWQFAFDTAALKAIAAASPSAGMATEIRNRERVMGTTVDYRRALRIRYVPAEQPLVKAPGVIDLEDYRSL